MNDRGQIMLSILFAVMIFFAGVTLFNFLGDDIDTARTALSCSDAANISDGTKLVCLVTDGIIPYFIISFISLAGGVITNRLLI